VVLVNFTAATYVTQHGGSSRRDHGEHNKGLNRAGVYECHFTVLEGVRFFGAGWYQGSQAALFLLFGVLPGDFLSSSLFQGGALIMEKI